MLKEANRMELMQSIIENINFKYPGDTEDFDPDMFIIRALEFSDFRYPAIVIDFLPTSQSERAGMNDLLAARSDKSSLYGNRELEAVTIQVYAKKQCEADSGQKYHGRLVADAWLRRIQDYIRRYWPKILAQWGASIKRSLKIQKSDLSVFAEATDSHAYQLSFYISTLETWDYIPDGETGVYETFDDANICITQDGEVCEYKNLEEVMT